MLVPRQMKTMSFLPYVAIVVVLLGIGLAGSFYVYERVDANLQKHILDRTNTIALMVDYENLKQLSGTEADLYDNRYRAMKATLQLVRLANPDVRFIYIVGQKPDFSLFFYMDSEKSDSEDYSPPGQTYDEASDMMYNVFKTGQSYSEKITDRWGTWVSGSAPIYDQYGQIIGLLGVDVPADQYLRNAMFYASIPLIVSFLLALLIGFAWYSRAQELNYVRKRGEFLAIASHEIRSPLTGIRWALGSVLTSKNPIGEDEKTMVLKAYANTVDLIYRISNFLSVNALEGKANELRRDDVPLRKAVKEVFDDLALTAAARNVKLEMDSQLHEGITVRANQEYLRQILFNIIVNAVKYTKENTRVLVAYALKGDMHEISISDQGNGIAKEDQERIFHGYERTAAAAASKKEGTGLGLFLTKEALKAHGGSIRVESILGAGTTFVIVLPVVAKV
jgi:signal transduction histidine kinase